VADRTRPSGPPPSIMPTRFANDPRFLRRKSMVIDLATPSLVAHLGHRGATTLLANTGLVSSARTTPHRASTTVGPTRLGVDGEPARDRASRQSLFTSWTRAPRNDPTGNVDMRKVGVGGARSTTKDTSLSTQKSRPWLPPRSPGRSPRIGTRRDPTVPPRHHRHSAIHEKRRGAVARQRIASVFRY
jgi:hypothetical protein